MNKMKTILIVMIVPFLSLSQTNNKPIDRVKLLQISGGFAAGIATDVGLEFTNLSKENRYMIMFATTSAYGIGLEVLNHERTGTWSISSYVNTLMGGLSSIAIMQIKEEIIVWKKQKNMKLML